MTHGIGIYRTLSQNHGPYVLSLWNITAKNKTQDPRRRLKHTPTTFSESRFNRACELKFLHFIHENPVYFALLIHKKIEYLSSEQISSEWGEEGSAAAAENLRAGEGRGETTQPKLVQPYLSVSGKNYSMGAHKPTEQPQDPCRRKFITITILHRQRIRDNRNIHHEADFVKCSTATPQAVKERYLLSLLGLLA